MEDTSAQYAVEQMKRHKSLFFLIINFFDRYPNLTVIHGIAGIGVFMPYDFRSIHTLIRNTGEPLRVDLPPGFLECFRERTDHIEDGPGIRWNLEDIKIGMGLMCDDPNHVIQASLCLHALFREIERSADDAFGFLITHTFEHGDVCWIQVLPNRGDFCIDALELYGDSFLEANDVKALLIKYAYVHNVCSFK